jgi:cell division protein FtsZ
MRLMEVDEAASHIKELVDPDANIIWGSAFNNDLGGRIRVSVVATGIEADAMTSAQPGKVFSFPARQAASVAAETVGATEMDETELEPEVATDEEEDELLLGADDILTSPVSSAPIAPPEDDDAAETPSASGGTLFERMSNIARGAPKAQIEDEEPDHNRDPIDIPRFLNRQNNQ